MNDDFSNAHMGFCFGSHEDCEDCNACAIKTDCALISKIRTTQKNDPNHKKATKKC